MRQEYIDILWELADHHSIFANFWAVGRLVESEVVPTAAIVFDKDGDGLHFVINPDYWASRTDYDKAFIIGHECLHVYLDHGHRGKGLDKDKANRAMDIVINHMLVDTFGFERDQLTDGEKYCWRDTMFPGKNVQEDRCFEYYYGLLEDEGGGGGDGEEGEGGPQTVDSHEFFGDVDPDVLQDVIDSIAGRMTPEEMEEFGEAVEDSNRDESNKVDSSSQAGTMPGNMTKIIKLRRVVKKKKWETVVVDLIGRFARMERERDIEVWTRDNRRLNMLGGDLMLPAEISDTAPIRDKIDLWFFQDTSGSCVDHAERFFLAAASIPEDRFRIRGFCFDTRVYEVDFRKGELQGFGGTAFQPIERHIQHVVEKEGCKYPQAVFVITDGYGSPVSPEYPDRWHWFLTEPDYMWGFGQSQTKFIPEKSRHYKLKDYE